ncbi:hypothetical protein, variant [Cryptococcus neoformans var. grubii H99]|uniref:Uncharacterized protein n=1 Tax=Cryptococcus neoformans (strain H99 / ATCC 208821 / CBS 10515 / FGSC 9487) TaxID=235443 RepID=T2BQ22_CRYN9|nr:hypothetical protein, variant [Cryptococcus neoformans var. grubii H99]AGV15343.1 hypothetical protein, variant [Cryptococcus neoformans var. grubii H99]AUB22292.1 hypothetical protein CKF44_00687 [Cryptococcus neoformans var. grubii]|eukprot:XP_012046891.1 hypothetical protein, variant [Cryptococcus neoformans var. grubii H99]
MPAKPTDNNNADRPSPSSAFFSHFHSTAQSAGLHPLYPALGPARAKNADTRRKERLRRSPQSASTSTQGNKKPVFVDLTQEDDSSEEPKKPKNSERRELTTAGVIDLTLSSEDDKNDADSDSSSIVIISSTMSSRQARKEGQRKREIEEDKRKGLSQARLSSLFARPRDENVSRPGSGSSPIQNSTSSPLSFSSSQTLRESLKTTSLTPKAASQPATTASAIKDSKSKGKERAQPRPVTVVAGPSKNSPSIFKTAADTELYRSAPATIPSSTPVKAPSLPKLSSQPPSSEISPSPSTSNVSTPVLMTARCPIRRTATPSSSPSSASIEKAIPTPTREPVRAPVVSPKLPAKNHIDETVTCPLKASQMTASLAASTHSEPTSSRSGRARPLPGAYALPAIDTPIHEWPTFQGTSTSVKKRKKDVPEVPGMNKAFKREVSVEIPRLTKRESAKESEPPIEELGQGSVLSPLKKLGSPSLSLLNQAAKQRQVRKASPTKQPQGKGKGKQKQPITSLKNIASVLDLKSLTPEPHHQSEIISKPVINPKIVSSAEEQRYSIPDATPDGSLTPPPRETNSIPPSSPLTELSDSDDDVEPEITETDKDGDGEKRELSSSTLSELIASPLSVAKEAQSSPPSLLGSHVDVEVPTSNAAKAEKGQEFQGEEAKEGVKDDESGELDLDEWDNFEWTVSTSPRKGDSENTPFTNGMSSYLDTPATPSKRSPSKPSPSALTPSRLAQLLLSPSKRPTPQTPHSTQKRATPKESSPTNSAKKRKLQVDKYAKMLEEMRALEQAEKEEERRKEEEEKRKMDQLLGAADDVEEEGQGNVADMLQAIANRSPQKPSSTSSFQDVVQSRQKARNERQEAIRKRKEEKEQKRRGRKEKEKKEAAAKQAVQERKAADKHLQSIFKGIKAGDDLEEALKDIEEDEKVETEGGTYPTPDEEISDTDDEINTDDELGGADEEDEFGFGFDLDGDYDLDELAGRMRAKGMTIEDELLRDAKVKDDQGMDLAWEGFWESKKQARDKVERLPKLEIEGGDEIIQELRHSIEAEDVTGLISLLASGILLQIDSQYEMAIGEWLWQCALSSSHPQLFSVATEVFLQWNSSRETGMTATLSTQVLSLLFRAGARKNILSRLGLTNDLSPITTVRKRESICVVSCRLIETRINAASSTVDNTALQTIIPVLLLLFIDKSSSTAVRQHINEAISVILNHAARVNPVNYARIAAKQIVKGAEPYGDDVRAAMLKALGQMTHLTREVHKWVGMEYISPGTLARMDQLSEPLPAPAVPHLLAPIQSLHESLRPPPGVEIDWNAKNFFITFLYAAIADIKGLVDIHPIKMDSIKNVKELMMTHPVEDLRGLIRLCRDRISDQGDGSKKVTVKARLHQLLEITRLVLEATIQRKRSSKPLGKGLKKGKGGQSRLSFKRKESIE